MWSSDCCSGALWHETLNIVVSTLFLRGICVPLAENFCQEDKEHFDGSNFAPKSVQGHLLRALQDFLRQTSPKGMKRLTPEDKPGSNYT